MKKILAITMILMVTSAEHAAFALAGLDAGSINSNVVNDLRIHEITTRNKAYANIVKQKQESEQKKLQELNQVALSDIKYVSFVNNSAISSKELTKVIQRYINQPMNVQNVSARRKEIMKYYQQRGFYSAVAMVSSENTQTGELVLNIKEGGKNSITLDK